MALLNTLTQLGIGRVSDLHATDLPAALDVVTSLRRLGIVQGHAMPGLSHPRPIASVDGVGNLNPVNITDHVQADVNKEDNRQKLREDPPRPVAICSWVLTTRTGTSPASFWIATSPFLRRQNSRTKWTTCGWAWKTQRLGDLRSCNARTQRERVAIDPDTGQALSVRPDQDGPPAVRTCPRCGSSRDWRPVQRTRRDLAGGSQRQAWTWSTFCSNAPSHFESPSRTMTARERRQRNLDSTPTA